MKCISYWFTLWYILRLWKFLFRMMVLIMVLHYLISVFLKYKNEVNMGTIFKKTCLGMGRGCLTKKLAKNDMKTQRCSQKMISPKILGMFQIAVLSTLRNYEITFQFLTFSTSFDTVLYAFRHSYIEKFSFCVMP